VTVVAAEPCEEDEARRVLRSPRETQDAAAEDALMVVNQVLRAQRAASADPTVREVGRDGALVVRLGYGAGEQVAEGRWSEAVELPRVRGERRRVAALRPQERLAALLGGRDRALACEELVLRARLDIEAAHYREAALQVRVALEAAIAELGEPGVMPAGERVRVDELGGHRGPIGEAANAALRGEPSPEQREAVAEAVARIEAALRARSAAGLPDA
jgi:hypothetical protein